VIGCPTPQRQLLARVAFWLYAAGILTLTHWPRLTIPETGLERTDLYVHLLVFGTWTILLNLTGYLGPMRAGRTIARCALAAAAYVCFDEGTQALPFIHRDARWDDLAANLMGVVVASIALAVLARRTPVKP
jgi:hypothetical protein